MNLFMGKLNELCINLVVLNIIHFKNNIMRKLFILSMCIFATAFTMSSCKSETTTTTETTTTETEVMSGDTTMAADTMLMDSTVNETKPTIRPN